jgi:hypothetical protein
VQPVLVDRSDHGLSVTRPAWAYLAQSFRRTFAHGETMTWGRPRCALLSSRRPAACRARVARAWPAQPECRCAH